MNPPLVSIALCTYNGSAYLKEQLDSLAGQTYTNLEIVIVDDGSTDDTITILKQYIAGFAQLNIKLYCNTENLGYLRNFEYAIGLCTGDYIALCDQDDIWDIDKIRLLAENIGEHMLIYHDSAFIDEEGNALNKKMSDIRNCYSGSDSRVFLFENCVSGHAMLFKRGLMAYAETFKIEIVHDWWLAYAATNIGSIYFLDKVLVQYRQHSSATTDILGQKRHLVKKRRSLEKLERQLIILRLFTGYGFNKDQDFKSRLLRRMEDRITSYTSFPLAWMMFRHRKALLYIQKKPALSKFNFVLKFLWGYKLKRLFQEI